MVYCGKHVKSCKKFPSSHVSNCTIKTELASSVSDSVQFDTKLVVPSVVVLLACDRVSGQHQQGPFPLLRATPDMHATYARAACRSMPLHICMRIAATLARNGAVAC